MIRCANIPLARSLLASSLLALTLCGLVGCKADYAVDITNKTPQPVFAKIFRKGGSSGMLGASTRLGPGDRAFLGPVRTNKASGALLSVDTLGNPNRPISVDILPGTAFIEVMQDGQSADSPIRIVEKK